MLVNVSDLTKRYPGVTAPVLDGVSLSLDAGVSAALTGESGSGKSTLLHIISGLEPFDSGSVTIDGAEISDMADVGRAELRRRKLGIVFQQFNLIPSLNVAKNLGFQASLSGQSCTPNDIRSMAQSLGIEEQLDKYPEELSGGQQQRVAIGRALMHRPQVVLADEPTGNLDEDTSDAVFDLLLSETSRRGASLLLATHSARLAARADRRLHLSHGRLAE